MAPPLSSRTVSILSLTDSLSRSFIHSPVFTYRYFLHSFPHLCIIAVPDDEEVDGKSDSHLDGKKSEGGGGDEKDGSAEVENKDDSNTPQQRPSSSRGSEDGAATDGREPPHPIGCVVAKIDKEEVLVHGQPHVVSTGYIGMLAVSESYRRRGIGKALVQEVITRMRDLGCTSVTLETEGTSHASFFVVLPLGCRLTKLCNAVEPLPVVVDIP